MTGSAVAPAVTTCWTGASSSSASDTTKPVSSGSSAAAPAAGFFAPESAAASSSSSVTSISRSSTSASASSSSSFFLARAGVAFALAGAFAAVLRAAGFAGPVDGAASASPSAAGAALVAVVARRVVDDVDFAAAGLVRAVVVLRGDAAAATFVVVGMSTSTPAPASARKTAFSRLASLTAACSHAVRKLSASTRPFALPRRRSSCRAGCSNSRGSAEIGVEGATNRPFGNHGGR